MTNAQIFPGKQQKLFSDMASTALPKGGAAAADVARSYVRHGGVLGLSAIVLSAPYSVPQVRETKA